MNTTWTQAEIDRMHPILSARYNDKRFQIRFQYTSGSWAVWDNVNQVWSTIYELVDFANDFCTLAGDDNARLKSAAGIVRVAGEHLTAYDVSDGDSDAYAHACEEADAFVKAVDALTKPD